MELSALITALAKPIGIVISLNLIFLRDKNGSKLGIEDAERAAKALKGAPNASG